MLSISKGNNMNIINNAWIRGLTGIGVAALIIAGATILFPMTETNFAGHILGWIMAGFLGIKITLSAFEDEESWMDGSLAAVEEAAVQMPLVKRREARATVDAVRLQHNGRMSWQPKAEPALEYPGWLNRAGRVVGEPPSRSG